MAAFTSCRSGGIGRRAWFRSMYPQGCGGSSPFFGTNLNFFLCPTEARSRRTLSPCSTITFPGHITLVSRNTSFWLPRARLRDKVTPLFDTKKDSQVPRFLVASTDLPTRALVKRAFAQFNIEAEECEGSMEAFASLHKKYDGIIVD